MVFEKKFDFEITANNSAIAWYEFTFNVLEFSKNVSLYEEIWHSDYIFDAQCSEHEMYCAHKCNTAQKGILIFIGVINARDDVRIKQFCF